MYRRNLMAAAVTTLGILSFNPKALAWGPEGHAIVADIAEAHLTAAAQTQVTQLLGLENHNHLDQVSSWADAVRSERRETAPWHFVGREISLRSLPLSGAPLGLLPVYAQGRH